MSLTRWRVYTQVLPGVPLSRPTCFFFQVLSQLKSLWNWRSAWLAVTKHDQASWSKRVKVWWRLLESVLSADLLRFVKALGQYNVTPCCITKHTINPLCIRRVHVSDLYSVESFEDAGHQVFSGCFLGVLFPNQWSIGGLTYDGLESSFCSSEIWKGITMFTVYNVWASQQNSKTKTSSANKHGRL